MLGISHYNEKTASGLLNKKGKFFQYEKRIVWHQSFEVEKYRLYVFLDDALKLREETDYISRIKNAPDGNTPEKYQQNRNTFGTIAFLCDDKQDNLQEVYENYNRLRCQFPFFHVKNILGIGKAKTK